MRKRPLAKVMIVDDQVIIREILGEYLYQHGMKPIMVPDGSEALLRLQEESVDCILVDYHMPLMKGVEFITELRVKGNRTPVIGISADHGREDEFLNVGAQAFIAKPFDVDALTTLIKEIISCKDCSSIDCSC